MPSTYWHFAGKDEIFLALFDRFNREIFAAWDDVSSSSALETLRIESEVVLETLLRDRTLVETWTEFLKHPLARERFASIYEMSRARFETTIHAGIQTGEIAPCEARHAGSMLIALVEGLLLQALADPSFDPREASYVEVAPGESVGLDFDAEIPADRSTERVEIVVDGLHEVTIEAELSAPGLVVLGDSFYPGWRATVDGEPAPILATNHIFRGVVVPAGRHEIRFDYAPASVYWGAAISFAGWLGWALVIRATRFSRRSVGAR